MVIVGQGKLTLAAPFILIVGFFILVLHLNEFLRPVTIELNYYKFNQTSVKIFFQVADFISYEFFYEMMSIRVLI
jgi:hypothetical protein